MQSYLSASRHPDTSRLVGTPLAVSLDVARYLPQVRFVLPREAGGGTVAVDAVPAAAAATATLSDTDASGIYQAQLTATDGAQHVERFAFNVAPDEGNLKKLDSRQLATVLGPIRHEYHRSGDINYNPQQLAGFNLSDSLLYLLIVVLLVEQVLAYVCSYHPPAREGAR